MVSPKSRPWSHFLSPYTSVFSFLSYLVIVAPLLNILFVVFNPKKVREDRFHVISILCDKCFVEYETRLGKNVNFWCISELGFKYLWNCDIWRYFLYSGIVEWSLGECISLMCSFSKIDFPDSLPLDWA